MKGCLCANSLSMIPYRHMSPACFIVFAAALNPRHCQ
jgi:hypothetical protein